MIHTVDQLREAARELGLSEVADTIANLALESLRIRTHPVEQDTLDIGRSRVGGLPDLPPHLRWPFYINKNVSERGRRESLGFLAQFNMQELARCAPEGVLPKTGMLYFFCATWECAVGGEAKDSNGMWRVLYADSDVSTLKRVEPPYSLPASLRADLCGPHAYPFAAYQLHFHHQLTLPELGTGYTRNLVLYPDEEDVYCQLMHHLELHPVSGEPEHRFLGHAQHVHYGAVSEGGSKRLLFQIDSEVRDTRRNSVGWQASGCGYFWIHPTALEQHDFSDVSLSMECT